MDTRVGQKIPRELIKEIEKRFTDQGRIIEAGWQGLLIAAIPADAPEVQKVEMRRAFFSGAHHLFASIISIMEPGQDPTEKDLERMTLIYKELEEFGKELRSQTANEN